MVSDFRTRKKDGRVFPVSGSNVKSDVNPMLMKGNPNGSIGARFTRFRERLAKAKEERLEAKTTKETKKLKEIEERLESRLKVETKRAEQRERLSEAELKLQKIEEREAETKAKLRGFTVAGKIEKRLKIGAEKFAESRRRRKEFLATPEGQMQIKAAKERRKKFFAGIKKAGKKFSKAKL